MSIKITGIIAAMMMICLSCQNNKAVEKIDPETYISKQVSELFNKQSICYSDIIILPGTGCSGCITNAEVFLKNNYQNTDYYFILTNITSMKLLNAKIGVNLSQYTNVFIDEENTFSSYESAIYPVRVNYSCDDHLPISVHFQKPGNHVF